MKPNYSLNEICHKITDGSHSSPAKFENGKPMLSVKNMRDFGFSFSNCKTISKEDFKKLVKLGCKPEINDVLIAKDGSVMKHIFRVQENIDAVLLSSIAILRPNLEIVNSQYLVYKLINPMMKKFILNNYKSGTGVPRIVLKDFKNIELSIPHIRVQNKIAHILSTLDDKIELNRKMNQTLEEMAQALFKSWFVDFDPVHAKANASSNADYDQIAKVLGISRKILDLFPDEFEESELGMIPKGWNWRKITEVCSTIGSGGTPKRMQKDNFNGGINWFTTKELKNNFILNSLETITKKGLDSSSAKLFPINTVVMAIYAAPTVGRLGILTHESTFNQAACGFVADENNISYEFLFLYLQDRNKFLNNLANGAAQQNLNVGLVKNLDVLISHKSIMVEFKAIVESIFYQIKTDIQQSTTLQKTRDRLLPKLLSGEVDVSELELDHVTH